MKYSAYIILPMLWTVFDRPDVTGKIYANGKKPTNLFGITIRLTNQSGLLISESVCTLANDNEFAYVFSSSNILDDEYQGDVIVTVFIDSGATAKLDGQIIAGAGSATIKGVVGIVPLSGWCKINDEWMSYTLSGSTITINRGLYNTVDAIQADDSDITFTKVRETCIPRYPYLVESV